MASMTKTCLGVSVSGSINQLKPRYCILEKSVDLWLPLLLSWLSESRGKRY